MKKTMIVLVLATMVAGILMATGCVSNAGYAQRAAEDVAGDGYTFVKAKRVRTDDSESHQMIAKMRLLGEGMSPNLDEYDFVELVDMKNNETGETITVVVVSDGGKETALMPENMTPAE